jgi:hypothetical protein
MKKILRNSRFFALAFIILCTTASASAGDSIRVRTVLPAELKFEGMIRNNPLFQLSIAGNQGQDEFVIHISDSWGNVLYRENVRAENFTKRFLFNYDELGEETVYLSVSSRKLRQEMVYEINRSTRSVEEYSINPLK